MIHAITWLQYWTTITIVVAIYYLLLAVIFHKALLKAFNKNAPHESPDSQNTLFVGQQRNAVQVANSPVEQNTTLNVEKLTNEDNILMPLVHDLVEQVKEFLEDVAQRSFVKEEVTFGIQVILKDYQKVIGSPYQQAVNDFIQEQCNEHCSIHLSNEEVKVLWFG